MAYLNHPPLHHDEQHRGDRWELALLLLGLAFALAIVGGVVAGA
jgi:hypothetical protein